MKPWNPTGSPWTIVDSRPAPALHDFLVRHEPSATVLSERLARYSLDRKLHQGGRFIFWENHAVVFQGSSGLFCPLGLEQALTQWPAAGAALRRRVGAFTSPRTVMGPLTEVELLGKIYGPRPHDQIDYDLLYLPLSRYPPREHPPEPDLVIQRPGPDQWRDLLELQIAYEVEEVLLPGRKPIPSHSRSLLVESLTNQIVFTAHYRRRTIARVATNARGFFTDQVGGVYTVPDWRGRGVAHWLMTHLLYCMGQEKKQASLFVKQGNPAAQKLYRKLGFDFETPYRIRYYQ